MKPPLPRLMLVTDRHSTAGRDLEEVVAEAVAGGVSLVQVRERDLGDEALRGLLLRLRLRLPPSVTLLVNGRPEIAHQLGLDVHLPAAAPLPDPVPSGLWGRSAHDEAEACRAVAEGAGYVVLGTIFPTSSKPGHPGVGPELVRQVAELVRPVPVYAIGGITASNAEEALRAGAFGVAVRGSILSAADPREAAHELVEAIERVLRASG